MVNNTFFIKFNRYCKRTVSLHGTVVYKCEPIVKGEDVDFCCVLFFNSFGFNNFTPSKPIVRTTTANTTYATHAYKASTLTYRRPMRSIWWLVVITLFIIFLLICACPISWVDRILFFLKRSRSRRSSRTSIILI